MGKYKVMSITDSICHLVCIRDYYAKYNPYLLYLVYPAKDRNGYPTRHRKLLAKYGDMTSVACYIRDLYLFGFVWKTVSEILAWNESYHA